MLASIYRLKGKKNFDKIKEQGKLYQQDSFGVCVLEKDKAEVSRFGFIISKKISKLAVNRNRVKRAMHEAIRQNLGKIRKGYDVLFLTKKNIADRSTEEIMSEVKEFIKNHF